MLLCCSFLFSFLPFLVSSLLSSFYAMLCMRINRSLQLYALLIRCNDIFRICLLCRPPLITVSAVFRMYVLLDLWLWTKVSLYMDICSQNCQSLNYNLQFLVSSRSSISYFTPSFASSWVLFCKLRAVEEFLNAAGSLAQQLAVRIHEFGCPKGSWKPPSPRHLGGAVWRRL